MRIRKRSQSVAVTTPLPQPISFKYQPGLSPLGSQGRLGGPSIDHSQAAECSNIQAKTNRGLEDHEERGVESPRFDVSAGPPVSSMAISWDTLDSLWLSDVHVEEDRDGALSGPRVEDDTVVPDKLRWRQASPKRRKIEHESRLLFEGSASMTAAELLVVNELANGVRRRLHAASEYSAATEVTKTLPSKPVENSKDVFINSIFFVFGTCGENGLSASEVVKYMLDQRLPGLKEGGARHAVQVANVLRSSSSFISLGDKKYLLCSSLDVSRSEPPQKLPSRQPPLKPSPASSSPSKQESFEDEDVKPVSSKNEDVSPQQKARIGAPSSKNSRSRSSWKPKPKSQVSPIVLQDERRPSDGELELLVVVKTTRRRGPSSSQKGNGPTQCKRYDGRGWQCSRLTEPGYSLCVHHQDLINKRAAKLKEQQTLSRLLESQHRKLAKTQTEAQQQQGPTLVESSKAGTETENGNAAGKRASRDPTAPVQKRKMLSLLAIK